MKKQIFAALTLTTALVTQPLLADEFVVEAPIKKVQIYQEGGATIFRSGRVMLPAGRHTVVIPKVSEEIEDDIAVTFKGAGVFLRSVETAEVISTEENNERKKSLIAERDQIDMEIGHVSALRKSKGLQQKFLETLASPANANNADPIKVQDWSQAITFVGEQSTALNTAILELDKQLKDLRTKRAAIKRQIDNAGSGGTDYQQIVISFETAQEREVELSASYFTHEASWSMDVRAALDTANNSLALTQTATIQQKTGIDWEGVNLVLSNTRPSSDFGNIDQRPTILRLRDKQELKRRQATASAPYVDSDMGIEEMVVTGSRTVRTSTSTFDKQFILNAPATIRSTGEKEFVEIGKTSHSTDLVVRSLPSRRQTAYAYADTTLQDFEAIRSITAELWRDDNMIGSGRWPDLEANTPLQLPFGTDEAVSIDYIEQAPQDGEKGFFKKDNVIEKHYLIRVTNNHSIAMPVEIFDKVPVSGHEDIDVEILKDATKATQQDMDGKEGLIMWRKTLQPGEVWEIKHQFRVTYPKDKLLNYR